MCDFRGCARVCDSRRVGFSGLGIFVTRGIRDSTCVGCSVRGKSLRCGDSLCACVSFEACGIFGASDLRDAWESCD